MSPLSRLPTECAIVHGQGSDREVGTLIQSIDRAARILSSLQGARHLGITELSAILDLPPSTVHGLVKSLQEQVNKRTIGYSKQDPGEQARDPIVQAELKQLSDRQRVLQDMIHKIATQANQ